MKASFVAYDYGELFKNSILIIVKYGYAKGCPKRPATQIGSLEILGVKRQLLLKVKLLFLFILTLKDHLSLWRTNWF
jgi:hypothetical protein